MRTKHFLSALLLLAGCAALSPPRALADNTELVAPKRSVAPTINGVEGAGEWNGATVVTITGVSPRPSATMKVMAFRDPVTFEEELYFLITVTEVSDDANNEDDIVIFFDMFHDHNEPGSVVADDVGFRLARNGALSRLTGDASSPTETPGWVPAAGQVAVSPLGVGPWTAEVKLKAIETRPRRRLPP